MHVYVLLKCICVFEMLQPAILHATNGEISSLSAPSTPTSVTLIVGTLQDALPQQVWSLPHSLLPSVDFDTASWRKTRSLPVLGRERTVGQPPMGEMTVRFPLISGTSTEMAAGARRKR